MFDIFAKLLSSIASILFPIFASYKALKTSDPAQLTPWLMYWVVLACGLLVESWTEWFLVWIPFYAYLRLFFLLYLVLPQTQGARQIYQTHVHPWLVDNEAAIDDLIASAHDRLRSTGATYLRRAIDAIRVNLLGLPPTAARPATPPATAAPHSYTQALLARFSLPSARGGGGGGAAADLYGLVASAVGAATGTGSAAGPGGAVPEAGPARVRFIASQREKVSALLSALDREATQLQEQERREAAASAPGGLNKSRSDPDFVKLEAESGAEEMEHDGSGVRRRAAAGSGWMPWAWGGGTPEAGPSSGVQK